MVVLTEHMVLGRTKATSLAQVKNLNLWGCDLTDMSILGKLSSVEVLSLSVNNISSLQDFQSCANLTELYLRKNDVQNLQDISFLKNLKNLKILWLCDNPCASRENYRLIVIKNLPNLVKLDNVDITAEERETASALQTSIGEGDALTKAARSSDEASSKHERPPASVPKDSNVLNAVLLLIQDLDSEGLNAVRSQCGQLLAQRGR
mmetsp:Transcript_52854/g.123516  ORF Transcript_52854/g.123516 Transcript_52854/m.123516 type:complete len:206 (-) Transcript_52854:28-645(-)